LAISPAEWGIDLLTGSGHKIRGPKGTGLLYRRKAVQLQPLLHGGGQESGLRSGTENVPGLVGLAKALRMTIDQREQSSQAMYRLRRRLLAKLQEMPGIVYNGAAAEADAAP